MNVNVNDLSLIYNASFTYPVARQQVEEALQGGLFRAGEPHYTAEEQEKICHDAQTVWNSVIAQYTGSSYKRAIFTAGAPGSGKTTLINQIRDRAIPYIDFDEVALKGMISTYVAENDPTEKAYHKWRPGSHYITHVVTANLWRLGLPFYFGTTSTSPYTKNTYQTLKELGYRLEIIHLSARDEARIDSIKKREESWVQSTPKDTIEKGKLFAQRINDTFLPYADQIEFYFRESVNADAELAATWTPQERLTVINPSLYAQIKEVHNAQVRSLDHVGKEALLWENSVEAN